jgi:hypothetical protein
MKILCVAPNPAGSGEAITAASVVRELARHGHEVRAFAHPFAARFFDPATLIEPFGATASRTEQTWLRLLRSFRPSTVLFADYALLFLSEHGRALLTPDGTGALDDVGDLVTLDHLGLGQGALTIGFGPPHLEPMPAFLPGVPARMRRLLPCPVQSPAPVDGRHGEPCRYLQTTSPLPAARRRAARARFVRSSEERLILHATPSWALAYCRRHGLPQPRFLARILRHMLGEPRRPVTIVCINAGDELPECSSTGNLRILRAPQLPRAEYDRLLLASDLMLTDNRVSVGLGKACCGGVPGAAVRNSFRLPEIAGRADDSAELAVALDAERAGSVFPFEVFPIWSREDVATLGVFAANPLNECVTPVELFGGLATRHTLSELLWSEERRAALRPLQREYAAAIDRLPPVHALVAGAVAS